MSWALGNTFGFSEALPTNENGDRVINPRRIDSLVVGIGLISFALFYMIKGGFINYLLPNWLLAFAGWLIPIIFLLRAIGDFKYVGFFKKVNSPDFGKRDTKYFSPLCLVLAIIGIIIELST